MLTNISGVAMERSETKSAIYQRERREKIKAGEWVVKARGLRGKGVTPEPQSSPVGVPGEAVGAS